MAACMAEAELLVEHEEGVYHRRFMRALHSSIERDRRMNRGRHLGYNGDNSDDVALFYDRHRMASGTIPHNR